MKTNKVWLIVIVAILLIASAATFWVSRQESESRIADIYQHGKLVKSIDLSKVRKPYTFRLEDGHGGWNDVYVRPGKIEISEANCPDQVCVNQGSISTGIEPIVCLPHELVIRIRGENDKPPAAIHSEGHHHEHHSSSDAAASKDDADIVVK